jgi:hypothetical protein
MTVTAQDAIDIHNEDSETPDDWEVVKEGEWTSEHKYEHRSTIYKHVPTGRYFAVHSSRSGSYWSDYEYTDDLANEVRPVEVTVTEYHAL